MQRVLVVDDDASIRNLICLTLRDEGFECLEAADGQAGVELAHSHQPDIILMDVMMPEINGIAAMAALKGHPETAHIPIIAMSAGINLREHMDELAADGVLGKPFDLDRLLALVGFTTRHAGDA